MPAVALAWPRRASCTHAVAGWHFCPPRVRPTNQSDLAALVAEAHSTFGRIDAVVNSTGNAPVAPSGELLDLSDHDWYAGTDMVFLNVVRMARLVTPIMAAQGGGAFVNISTFAALEPDPTYPVSSCMRAALAGYTKLFLLIPESHPAMRRR